MSCYQNHILKRLTVVPVGLLLLLLFALPDTSHAWLFFSKPAYQGQVVDLETGDPIEGAVVVAIYYKESFAIGDSAHESVIHVQETLTDQDGNFHIPPYSTMISPNASESATYFIVYKAGFVPIYKMDLESCLSAECEKRRVKWVQNLSKVREISTGKVALPALNNNHERRLAIPGTPIFDDIKSYSILLNCIENERKTLGID